MGEYEPEDSRIVTLSTHQAPGEPPRTGPREDQARREAQQEQDGSARMEQDVGTAAVEQGAPLGTASEGGAAADPARLRRDAERPLGGS